MPYKFFDNLLDSSKNGGRTKRKLTLPVSIGIHLVVLAGVLHRPVAHLRRSARPRAEQRDPGLPRGSGSASATAAPASSTARRVGARVP